MRRVCFLGTATSAFEKEQLQEEIAPDTEIWAVNEAHWGLGDRKPDRVFQMHVRDWRESERRYLGHGRLPKGLHHNCFGRNREHVEYLRTCGVPVYSQQIWQDIPTSLVYPFEEVREAVGIPLPPLGDKRLWATSSFGYMTALLITEHLLGLEAFLSSFREVRATTLSHSRVDELQLIGVELPLGTTRERIWEWPNFAYYLGLATGLGIKLVLPSTGTALLSAPHYALGGHPWVHEADHWWVPGYGSVVFDEEELVYRLGTYVPPAIP
jgi:hypothetical protein